MSRTIKILSILVLLSFSACLRFVPSTEVGGSSFAGEDEFFSYESKLQNQLDLLVKHRNEVTASRPRISSYRVGAGDLLEIAVFGLPEMGTSDRVTPTGKIALPLVGDVDVLGLTLEEVRVKVTESMRTYVRNPQISVFIREYEAHKVSVVGEVATPGVYPLMRNDYTLLEVLSKAGGRTERAGARVILIPSVAPKELAKNSLSTGTETAAPTANRGVEIKVQDLFGGLDSAPINIPLFSGDTIIVPEAGTFEIDGEITKPGSYRLSTGTTALSAVAAAGGLTYAADVNSVEVVRDIGTGKKAAVVVDLEEVALRNGKDIQLRPGDLVRVPSASGRFAGAQVVEVINSIFSGVGGRVN